MHEISTHLIIYLDPGHGWLRVPLADIVYLGLETAFSSCSFLDDRYAYLEEDVDAPRYLSAVRMRGIQGVTIHEVSVSNFDRSRRRFGELSVRSMFGD